MNPSAPPSALLKWLAIGFALLTLLITLVFFGWWSMKERLMFGSERYDPVRWMAPASHQTSECQRGEMVRDIRQRLLRPGMRQSEVLQLLGRPAWEETGQVEYELGKCLFVIHGLRLYFDSDQRLVHSAIVQH